jgi:hypothetical protein
MRFFFKFVSRQLVQIAILQLRKQKNVALEKFLELTYHKNPGTFEQERP